MALLGGLEHGVYVDEENDDCAGMSVAEIREHFGLEPEEESDNELSAEEDDGTEDGLGDDDEDSIVVDPEEDQFFVESEGELSEEEAGDDDEEARTLFQEEAEFPAIVRVYCYFPTFNFHSGNPRLPPPITTYIMTRFLSRSIPPRLKTDPNFFSPSTII